MRGKKEREGEICELLVLGRVFQFFFFFSPHQGLFLMVVDDVLEFIALGATCNEPLSHSNSARVGGGVDIEKFRRIACKAMTFGKAVGWRGCERVQKWLINGFVS